MENLSVDVLIPPVGAIESRAGNLSNCGNRSFGVVSRYDLCTGLRAHGG